MLKLPPSFEIKTIIQFCATYFYEIRKNEFQYIPQIKTGYWYQFANHRWNRIEEKILMNCIEHEEYLKFLLEIPAHNPEITANTDIIKELSSLFYDDDFKLDSNPNLLGFNNGVYDLKTGLFRDGKPTDCVSLSVGYDYKKYDDIDSEIFDIKTYLSHIFPHPKMRDHILTIFSSFLDGHYESTFYILTGPNCERLNFLDFFKLTCGQYAKKIPSEIFAERHPSNFAFPELANVGSSRIILGELEGHKNLNMRFIKEFISTDFIPNHHQKLMLSLSANQLSSINYDVCKILRVEPSEYSSDTSDMDNLCQAFMYILLGYYKSYKKTKDISEPIIPTTEYPLQSGTLPHVSKSDVNIECKCHKVPWIRDEMGNIVDIPDELTSEVLYLIRYNEKTRDLRKNGLKTFPSELFDDMNKNFDTYFENDRYSYQNKDECLLM